MKTKTILSIAFTTIIFSCGNEKSIITEEFKTFKTYTDSLLDANNEYLKGIDTEFVEFPSQNNPEVVLVDTVIVKHSNLFDTSQYNYTVNVIPLLSKYNAMEQHFDSAMNKMDAKTLELFKSIKQKMNDIKQPIK